MTSSGQQRDMARTPAFIAGAPVSVAVVAVAVVALIVGRGGTSTPAPNAGEVRPAVESAAETYVEEHDRLMYAEFGDVRADSRSTSAVGGSKEVTEELWRGDPAVTSTGGEPYAQEHERLIAGLLALFGEPVYGYSGAPPASAVATTGETYAEEHERLIQGTLGSDAFAGELTAHQPS